MAKILLVHGAFQGGWVWSETAADLSAHGHEVHRPTLSGCGYLHHGLRNGIDLNTYIQDVSNYIQFEALDDVVLVAHSFSGMICGAVAMRTPHLVNRVVYVDAIIPETDRSFVDIAGEAFRHMLESHRTKGGRVMPWPLQVFGVPDHKSAWFQSRLCDFPEASFHTRLPGEFAPSAVPAAYITCLRTPSPFIRAMAAKAARYGWHVSELDSGHSPMTSNSSELARLVHAYAAAEEAPLKDLFDDATRVAR